MQNSTNLSSSQEPSPFFDLLAEAQEIKIREVSEEKNRTLSQALSTDSLPQDESRTFLVCIKTKPATPTPKTDSGNQTGEKSNPENRTYLLKSAELLLSDGDYLLARNVYSYLLKINLRDPEAMQGLGLCFMKLNDTSSAKKCFKALYELKSSAQAILWLAQCCVSEGNDDAAIEYFSKITHVEAFSKPEQFEFYKEAGNCHTRKGNFDTGWGFYHKALELSPNSDTIYVNLGTLEMQRNQPEIALPYFKMALRLNDKNARAHCGLGIIASSKQDKETAKGHFLKALDIDSQNLLAVFQLANLLGPGEKADALKIRVAKFLLKEPKHADVRYLLAVLLFRESDWLGCEREVDAVIAIDPNHTKAKSLRDQLKSHKHQVK